MSSALAISAVTGVLRTMLNNVYTSAALGSVKVSSVAPDIVQSAVGTNSDAPFQVNLFLHQVTPNAAYRNEGLASLAADGGTRTSNPPLAIDLHYLLTVYAGVDGGAESLLGYAIQLLHEFPVLSRNQIQSYLNSLPLADPLRGSGLAQQIELIKITPATIGREELAWIWTALKADYRPTYPFQVSVVLIESRFPVSSALPVLSRTLEAHPNLTTLFPLLTEISPPNGQPVATLGDVVTVTGRGLTGATSVLLQNARLGFQRTLSGLANVGDSSFQFTVPDPPLPPPQPDPTDIPAGVYLLTANVPGPSGIIITNALPFIVAPKITTPPPSPLATGVANVSVSCAPYVRPGHQVSLLIGGQEAIAKPFTAPTNSPSFRFPNLLSTGGHAVPVRLRVDGIDSPIIDMTKTPPAFSGPMVQVN
jgi:hypothetical protein